MCEKAYVVFIFDKDDNKRNFDTVTKSVTLESLKEVSQYLHSLPGGCTGKVDKVTFVGSEFFYETIMRF